MNYFVIKGRNAGGRLLFYWTGKEWCSFAPDAKRYKSRKVAENAVRRTVSNPVFDRYNRKQVVEVSPVVNNK